MNEHQQRFRLATRPKDVHGLHAVVAIGHVQFDIEAAPRLFRPAAQLSK